MFKKLLTSHVVSNPSLLTAFPSTSKVIFRKCSEQNINIDIDIDIDANGGEKWDLLSAVCLERHSVITKPMNDIEERYRNLLQQLEAEKCMLSDFELQQEEEKSKKEKVTSEGKVTFMQPLEEFEALCEQELNKFKFAPRHNETEDKVLASLRRKLDKNLLLVVEQKIGDTNFWIPPQSIRQRRETMIQTAHRSVQELCGTDVKVKFYGNAPIGFYKFKYPKCVREEGRIGAKIFYFLAKYMSGEICSNTKHCWLDRKELKTTIHPHVYKSLSQFLLLD